MQSPQMIRGKPISFDTLRVGKTLLKLKDGNYLEVTLNVLKCLRGEAVNPDGSPQYLIQTSVAVAYWKKEELAQLDE